MLFDLKFLKDSRQNFKNFPAISLYWFAAQQQTSSHSCQKSHFIYSKFSAEWNELTPSVQKPREVA